MNEGGSNTESTETELDRLRASEELHREVLRHVTDAVFVTDAAGRLTFVCPNADLVFGYAEDEVAAMGRIQALLGDAILDDPPSAGEIRRRPVDVMVRDGGLRHLSVDIRAVAIGEGRLLFTCRDETRQRQAEAKLAALRDDLARQVEERTAELAQQNRSLREQVAARRRVEAEWRRSEQTARALLDAAPDSALLLEPDGTVVDINQFAARALRTTREEIRGRCAYDFLPPEIAAARRRRVGSVLATGEPARFEDVRHGRVVDNFIWPLKDDGGRVWRLAVFGRDVTAYREAEASLEGKRRELRTILDALPQMVVFLDAGFVYRFVNRTYAAVFRLPAEKLIGRCVSDVIGTEAWRTVEPLLRRALAGETVEFEEEYPFAGRSPRAIQGHLVPAGGGDGSIFGCYAILSDVTELRQALAQARTREAETVALLEAARAVLGEGDFTTTARAIFDICCRHTGALSGYVAMLSEDGAENELLFLEAGGLPCDVDPELPMPIRGLRAEAYRERRPVFDNDFPDSDWMRFMPAGHVRLDNVLFAPLVVDGRAVGLIGVANKPGGFDAADARLAGALGDLAAVAFRRIRDRADLEESEARYRTLFENAADAIFVADPDTGALVDANRQAEALLGMPREEIVGRHQSELHPPEGVDEYRHKFAEAARLQGSQFDEVEVVCRDGRRVPVEVNSGGTIQAGSRRMHFGIFRDISARKRMEDALRRSEARFRALLEASPAAILVVQDGRYIYVNPAGMRLMGVTAPEEIEGRPAIETIHPDHRPLIVERMRDIAAGRPNPPLELKVLSPDGRVHVTESVSVPVELDGRAGALIIGQDVTARKRAEAALRASEARLRALSGRLIDAQEQERRRLAAELHDEMGQALLVLKLQLRAAVGRLPAGCGDLRGEFEGLLDQINEMVDGVRRVARELSPAVLENLGLAPAVEWLAEQGRSHFGWAVDLHLDPIQGLLPPEAERAVFRIAQEALTNVGKHADAGRVAVHFEKRPPSLVVSVADDGRGFDPEETLRAPDDRHGIGLMTLQERARLIGGALDIHSAKGEGTRVTLTLPLP